MKDKIHSVINLILRNIRITKPHTQESKQSDVQPKEVFDKMYYDPNEYLGRSQVIKRKKTFRNR